MVVIITAARLNDSVLCMVCVHRSNERYGKLCHLAGYDSVRNPILMPVKHEETRRNKSKVNLRGLYFL